MKAFRVFVSSTFSDLKKEREVLHEEVLPILREYSLDKGFTFQFIDLRWGINEEAQIDQKTLQICLDEVQECVNEYPQPNFILILGDRYGWIPIPSKIESIKFKRILNRCNPLERKLLKLSFKLDRNQIKLSYFLKPQTFFDDKYPINFRRKKLFKSWEIVEKKIIRTLIKKDHSTKYLSATQKEYENSNKDKNNILIFSKHSNNTAKPKDLEFRKFKNLLSKEKKKIIPLEDVNEKSEFISTITSSIKKLIDIESENKEKYTEQEEHKKFKEIKTDIFKGREKDIGKIKKYIKNENESKPFIIHGSSGIGKTSLIAETIKEIEKDDSHYKNPKVIYRFIGASSNSKNLNLLLDSIIKVLKLPITEKKLNKKSDLVKIHLEELDEDRKTIIFIDALDQLENSKIEDILAWIPSTLKKNTKIILSTLNDENYKEDSKVYEFLKDGYSDNALEIGSLDFDETLLKELLKSRKRRLQSSQIEVLETHYKNNEDAKTPLYIKVLLETLIHYKDNDDITNLPKNQKDAINAFVNNLKDFYHEEEFYKKALAYIALLDDGISEVELIEPSEKYPVLIHFE